jgi:predicted transport protein
VNLFYAFKKNRNIVRIEIKKGNILLCMKLNTAHIPEEQKESLVGDAGDVERQVQVI